MYFTSKPLWGAPRLSVQLFSPGYPENSRPDLTTLFSRLIDEVTYGRDVVGVNPERGPLAAIFGMVSRTDPKRRGGSSFQCCVTRIYIQPGTKSTLYSDLAVDKGKIGLLPVVMDDFATH